jgi:hypothetical protein
MFRRLAVTSVLAVTTVTAAGALAASGLATSAAAAGTPISLVVPQSTAFTVLGYDCGGIGEKPYVTGFDPSTGYPSGDVYLWTTCSAGGRGGHSTTFSAWVSTLWDFTGALVTYSKLATAPTVNPAFSAFDAHGNEIYNSPPFAYLALAAGFVPAPRVAAVSPVTAPQGSTVTITGTGFTNSTAVRFGHVAASFTVTSDTSITAVAPAVASGLVNVFVTGPGGTSAVTTGDQFTFNLIPRVGALSPNHGTADGGTKVVITGSNLGHPTAVAFSGLPAKFTVVSGSKLVATAPPGPDSGVTVDVTVTNKYGTSAVGPANAYLYTN